MDTVKPNNSDTNPGQAVWAITPNGIALAETIYRLHTNAVMFVPEGMKPAEKHLSNSKTIYFCNGLRNEIAKQFKQFKSHIFIFSTGIAVRMIAPLLQSKDKDPAVVVVDEKGFHVISLISGHLGGANELCKKIADKINAVPVITTATDINHLPSIDLIAKDENLFIENIEAIKNVNMAFLKNIPIKIDDPANLLRTKIPRTLLASSKTIKDIDIACTWKIVKVPRETLILRPKNLFIGVGCNRGTPSADIHEFVTHVFKEEGLSLNSIAAIGTTSVKSDEKGILDLAEKLDRPINFYEKDELNSVTSIKNPSEMAKKHLGVNSVCEAAAILGAQGGSLIVQKKKTRDVTLAVAIQQ